jgi:hypothetical protein
VGTKLPTPHYGSVNFWSHPFLGGIALRIFRAFHALKNECFWLNLIGNGITLKRHRQVEELKTVTMPFIEDFNVDWNIEPTIESLNGIYRTYPIRQQTNGITTTRANLFPLEVLRKLKAQESLDADAIAEVMNLLISFSQGLANTIGMQLDDFGDFSNLLEQMKTQGIVTNWEWNRLTVIQMVLDGLDMEISEDDGEVPAENVDYALEFCEIMTVAYGRLAKSLHPPRHVWSSFKLSSQTDITLSPESLNMGDIVFASDNISKTIMQAQMSANALLR